MLGQPLLVGFGRVFGCIIFLRMTTDLFNPAILGFQHHLHAGGDFFFDTGPSFFSGLSDPETLACESGKCWDGIGEILVTFFFESKNVVLVYCSWWF